MAQTGFTPIQLYGSTTTGNVPLADNMKTDANGIELAVNAADRKMYVKNGAGTVVPIGGGASGGGANQVFYENDQNVTVNYTITAGKNAMSTGPITVESGIIVTVPSGTVWVVL
jgi:hypothetical protein